MSEKKDYRVLITETHQKTIVITARSEREARRRAEDAWKNSEYMLGDDCFQGAEFHVMGESEVSESDKGIERIDEKNAKNV